MKTPTALLAVLLALANPLLHAGDSKRTAEYILTTPTDFEGKEVTLDVAFVKPVHWKSPNPDLAFFHAITMDRVDHKPGGNILVAIPAADAAKFAKKFGTDFEGRHDMTSLRGTLVTTPGKKMKRQVWLIDTTGKIPDLIMKNAISIDDEGGGGEGGMGPGGLGGHGPRRPMMGN